MDISLEFVVEAARRRLAALTPEVVGYVVLLVAQRVAPRPSRVSPLSVLLTEGGDVDVRPEPTASEFEVETSLRGLLATFLELSPSPLAPAITAVSEAQPNGSLQAFIAELSAALIPINHAAAHRALARLYRETVRAQGPGFDNAPPPASREGPPVSIAGGVAFVASEVRETSPEVQEIDGAPVLLEIELRPQPIEPTSKPHEAPIELTATPPPVAPYASIEGARALDIDVELDPHRERAAAAASERSDVRELLQRYLAQTRSDEGMTRTLCAMIDLDDRRPPRNGAMHAPDTTAVSP